MKYLWTTIVGPLVGGLIGGIFFEFIYRPLARLCKD
jgi:glycerol uptake facilitator-like aquaporin